MPSNIISNCNVNIKWFLTLFATCIENIPLVHFLIDLSKISFKFPSQGTKYNYRFVLLFIDTWLNLIDWELSWCEVLV